MTRRVRVAGRIVPHAGRYRLTLTVHEGGSVWKRTMDSDSCADLAGAAAVVLGLFFEQNPAMTDATPRSRSGSRREAPGARREPSAEPPASPDAERDDAMDAEPPSTDEPPAEPRTEPAPSPAPRPSRPETQSPDFGERRRWHALLTVPVALLDLGPISDSALTYGGGLGLRLDAWRVIALGRLPRRTTLSARDFPDVDVEIERLGAELWVCRGWRAGPLELGPCLSAALEHRTARGVGPEVVGRSARALSLALGGGAVVQWFPLEWVALTGTALVRVESSRPRLVIDGLGEVARFGPAQVSFSLGPEWIF
ncbi:MAG TPA: hypothetical protein VKY73_14925 [Polyangiaceae bacterium]|nr:hypothetical protein [Polyangiaceae bacterium]